MADDLDVAPVWHQAVTIMQVSRGEDQTWDLAAARQMMHSSSAAILLVFFTSMSEAGNLVIAGNCIKDDQAALICQLSCK